MAGRGRPRNTTNPYKLMQRMLKKKDVLYNGKKITRQEALLELIWQEFYRSRGKNITALKIIMEYSGGKAVPSDKVPKNEKEKKKEEISFLERNDFLDKLIEERIAEKEKEAAEKKKQAKKKKKSAVKKGTGDEFK